MCPTVYSSAHTSSLVNVCCNELLVQIEITGFHHTINSGSWPGLLTVILLLPCVVEMIMILEWPNLEPWIWVSLPVLPQTHHQDKLSSPVPARSPCLPVLLTLYPQGQLHCFAQLRSTHLSTKASKALGQLTPSGLACLCFCHQG